MRRSPYHPSRPPSQILPGTGGSYWGWGFSLPISGSAWKDSREVIASRGLSAAAAAHTHLWRGIQAQGKGEVAEQGLKGVAVKFLGPPGVLGAPPIHRGVLLPVPIHATEAQGREQGQGDEDQDDRQDPHGQSFRAARKEKGALASGEGKAGGPGGGGRWSHARAPPAPALC